MKLCKDCKHFQEASEKEAFCLHPQALKFDDPIYGDMVNCGLPNLAL